MPTASPAAATAASAPPPVTRAPVADRQPPAHPFAALPSQLPKPPLQAPSWQLLATQFADAFEKLQTVVHVPQWAMSLVVFVSHPFALAPSLV